MKRIKSSSRPIRRWLWIGLAVAVLVAVVVVLLEVEDVADVTRIDAAPPDNVVSVLQVSVSEAAATVSVFAELRPRWDSEIRAAVSGRIIKVHDTALAGTRIKASAPLFSIEKTQYKTAVAAAETSFEEAKLVLLRANNKVIITRRQFERDGVTPPTDLALHLPELRIAERSLASSQAQLEAAKRQLADAEVIAPFSGFITKRMASLGQTVSVGEPLVNLSDDSDFELMVELSQADWALLEQPIAGRQAQLFHRDGTSLGQALIRQGGGFMNPETRQMRVFLEVSNAQGGMLAGDFLRVSFAGRHIPDTLTIPETALTRAGYIWKVDDDNLLQRIVPDILFRTDGMITISAQDGPNIWRIAKTPLASFLPGQRVNPQLAED